jgi:hypothetical protein
MISPSRDLNLHHILATHHYVGKASIGERWTCRQIQHMGQFRAAIGQSMKCSIRYDVPSNLVYCSQLATTLCQCHHRVVVQRATLSSSTEGMQIRAAFS